MALYGKMPSVTYQDYPEAAADRPVGREPVGVGHSSRARTCARRRSAAPSSSSIDPRTTPLARSADVHLAVQAGHRRRRRAGDPSVSLRERLRRRGVSARAHARRRPSCASAPSRGRSSARRELAGIDAGRARTRRASSTRRASPALIRCGWGLERNRNGGNAAMAVLALPAVGGKFGVRGGGYSMSNSASWNIERPWIGAPEPDTRLVNMNHLGPRAAPSTDDPPVNVLFVYNCNPVATVPDQHRIVAGLEREDLFTVVFEQVMTDTALYADVVLPATTFLEGYDFAQGVRADQPRAGAAGHRRRRRIAIERRRLRRAVRAARRARRRRADGRARSAGAACSTRCRRPIGDDLARRAAADAAVRPGADPVRGRVPEHAGSQGRSVSRPRSSRARRWASIAFSPIRRPTAIRSRSSRRRASGRSARRSASCRGPTSSSSMHPDDAAARGLADKRSGARSSTSSAKCTAR